MKAPVNEPIWYAVYKRNRDGSARPVAIFEREEDAQQYHANPELYTVVPRRVRLMPAPIILPPLYSDIAFQYVAQMASPTFEPSGAWFEEIQSFVAKYDEAAGLTTLPRR